MSPDPVLQRVVPALTEVPGVAAIVLGGSHARGTATETSDYDIGLYYSVERPLDTDRLLQAVRTFADAPETAKVTPIGGSGPWIGGGGWLGVAGHKVDLLYRNIDDVANVIAKCGNGEIDIHYQPGHPHGFCTAIWMGEVALCRPLHDPDGRLAKLKAATSPCALNERYLINEKGALQEAAKLPLTLADVAKRANEVWRLIGSNELRAALAGLRAIARDVKLLASESG